jgi:hypothetical protein
MRKPFRLSILATALAVSALLLMASAASAVENTTVNFANAPSGAHFAGGTSAPSPFCTVSGTTVTCPNASFQIAGVGNANATENLSVTYSQTVNCRNNGGQIVESHQTSATASATPTPLTADKNGRLTVPANSITGTPGAFTPVATCPNPNWDAELAGTPTVTSYTYTLTFAGQTAPVITVTGP